MALKLKMPNFRSTFIMLSKKLYLDAKICWISSNTLRNFTIVITILLCMKLINSIFHLLIVTIEKPDKILPRIFGMKLVLVFLAYLVRWSWTKQKKKNHWCKKGNKKDRGEMRHVSATSWGKIEATLISFWEIMIFSHICLLSLAVHISA